jgi:very-short-patch-repair endonuclease
VRRELVEIELAIGRIAGRQHRLIGIEQLRSLGVSDSAVSRRVATGRLYRVFRGVYAVGTPDLTQRGRWKAATMACGEGAVLSHRSAAELWRIVDEADGDSQITVPVAGGRARRDGIRLHRIPSLPSGATTARDNIPVTKPQRTLEDLSRQVTPGELRVAVRQAEFLELPVDAAALVPDLAASPLELEFLRLVRRHHLPRPEVNVWIGRYRVDFLWRARRVIVETDGRRAHTGAVASAEDQARDRKLTALGFVVLRFTYGQVVGEARDVAAQVRAALRGHDASLPHVRQ